MTFVITITNSLLLIRKRTGKKNNNPPIEKNLLKWLMRQTLHDEKYFSSFLFFLWFQYNKDHIMNDFLPATKTVRLYFLSISRRSKYWKCFCGQYDIIHYYSLFFRWKRTQTDIKYTKTLERNKINIYLRMKLIKERKERKGMLISLLENIKNILSNTPS